MYFIILSRQDVSKLAPFRHTKMMTWLLSCATWFFLKKRVHEFRFENFGK
jgi:hypothetical protein